MFVQHRFHLDHLTKDYLQSLVPRFGYNGFGELVYRRTYSRIMSDGQQENWADSITRVTEGTFSIRKNFYLKNGIPWDEKYWQDYAQGFAVGMFEMKWLPPGRGLWAMGSDFVYERGSMALYNCAFTTLGNELSFDKDIGWLMDSLMHGVGVGFEPTRDDLKLTSPAKGKYDNIIHDSREGWVESVEATIRAYLNGTQLPYHIYDRVRGPGMLIKGFGGVSSGPEPLRKLHTQIVEQCELFLEGKIDVVELKTNLANITGTCVVAGNVRRSAEIGCGSVHDQVFMNLKDYTKYPHREEYGWMSNNSVGLETQEEFDMLGEIAKRVIRNGEPGVFNRKNMRYGRIGKFDNVPMDRAIGFNPCGEIPLENKEVCNLAETLPTMCNSVDEWYQGCEYATFYCSTVTLLPTHQPATNKVVARNRRIGVSIIDFSGWKHAEGVHKVTRYLRNGYEVITEANKALNAEAGVPEAIRKTCVKPGGTTPKLPGKTSGAGHPTFDYTVRRIRVAKNSAIYPLLVDANIPHEPLLFDGNTEVFEYPILQGPAKPASQVSLWEQANNIVLLQREWADNAVSNTLYFKPKWVLREHVRENVNVTVSRYIGVYPCSRIIETQTKEYIIEQDLRLIFKFDDIGISEALIYEYDPNHEEDDIEAVLSSIIPVVKSVSLLPHSAVGAYKQMPEEGITKEEYELRLEQIKPIDWSLFHDSDGEDEKYCQGDVCERPPETSHKT